MNTTLAFARPAKSNGRRNNSRCDPRILIGSPKGSHGILSDPLVGSENRHTLRNRLAYQQTIEGVAMDRGQANHLQHHLFAEWQWFDQLSFSKCGYVAIR